MMKTLILAFTMLSVGVCHAQVFRCGAQGTAGTIYKFEMDVNISDSSVAFISHGRETKYKRLPATGDKIYFTDGQQKNAITIFPTIGTKKGFNFTYIINQEMNLAAPKTVTSYCIQKN